MTHIISDFRFFDDKLLDSLGLLLDETDAAVDTEPFISDVLEPDPGKSWSQLSSLVSSSAHWEKITI